MATYRDKETMITAGIYQKGTSPEIDEAVDKHDAIEQFLMQDEYEVSSIGDTLAAVAEISGVPIPEEELVESPAVAPSVTEATPAAE